MYREMSPDLDLCTVDLGILRAINKCLDLLQLKKNRYSY